MLLLPSATTFVDYLWLIQPSEMGKKNSSQEQQWSNGLASQDRTPLPQQTHIQLKAIPTLQAV